MVSGEGHSKIDLRPKLAAMLSDGEGIALPDLEKMGVNVAQLGHAPLRRLVNANQTMPSLNPL